MQFNKMKRNYNYYDNHEPYYDDDISIDFIDDSPKSPIKQSIDDKLNIISKKLENIEEYLKQLIKNKQNDDTALYSETTTMDSNIDLGESFNPSNLYAPKNVRPQGSMLEEIQQVLTTQNVMEIQQGQNVVNTVCSPNIAYDDDI